MAGTWQDKDGDGLFSWYVDPKNPNEKPSAGVDKAKTEDISKDKPVPTPATQTPANTATVTGGGIYNVTKADGTVESMDRTMLAKYLYSLPAAEIKKYQSTLASLKRYNGPINGKLDPDNKLLSAVIDALDYQQTRGVSKESILKGITALGTYTTSSSSSTANDKPKAVVSSKGEIQAEITDSFGLIFGDAVPKDIASAYYEELTALQKSRTTKTKIVNGVEVSTEGISPIERQDILNKYINQYANTKILNAATGDAGAVASLNKGSFGSTLTTLRNAYSNNGLPINDKSLAQQAAEISLDKNKLDSTINLINLQAQTYFPALSEKIGQGYTVKQLLSPYIQTRANILEEDPDSIDLKSLTQVAQNPKGLMGLYDYEISLRKDPKWRYTKNAQDNMSKLSRGIAEMFGLVG
jgi:hypothetical protein